MSGVVASTTARSRAAEVDVALDLLGHLLRRADEVAGPPRLERLAPERAASRAAAISASVSRTNTSGDHVLVISSSSRPTAAQWPFSTSRLWAHSWGLPPKFAAVGVAGDDPQRELLAAAADPDRRVRLLERLRVALGAVRA